MADRKVGEDKPEKPQRAGATEDQKRKQENLRTLPVSSSNRGKIPVTACDGLKKKLQTSQRSLQRSPHLDLPSAIR